MGLCAQHLAVVEDDDYENPAADAVDQILAHPTMQGLVAKVDAWFTKLTSNAGKAQPKGPPPPGPRPPQQRPGEDPRTVLGFGATVALTIGMVKERRKKLAGLYHPDQGGSDEAMRRINAAADALLKELR